MGGDDDKTEPPKFQVIQGGGTGTPNREPHDRYAWHLDAYLQGFAIEILRAIARGNDAKGRVAVEVQGILDYGPHSAMQLPQLVDGLVERLHADVDVNKGWSEHERETRAIVSAALVCAAEAFCGDNFAKARLSRARAKLREAIVAHHESQQRRRAKHEAGRRAARRGKKVKDDPTPWDT